MISQVSKFHCMASMLFIFTVEFILAETVAIKAIDMKGVKDAISREMLEC